MTAWAQNAKLAGKIIDKDTKEPIPFAGVKLFSGGALKGGAIADFDGNYSISPINPGTYDLEASAIGYGPYRLEKITFAFEETKRIQITLQEASRTTGPVVIEAYKKELIGVSSGEKVSLSADEIAKIPTRNVNTMIATQANVYSADDGAGVNIKGMRTSDNAVFINGIRQFGTSLPPAESIAELSIVTGGIPAQYGDALGGIISITTKTAAQKISYGVQGETSSLFDKWHYNFVGINGSGPIWKKKEFLPDGTQTEGKTILGFFGAVQYTSNVDGSPSAIPIYKANSQSLDILRNSPLTRFGTSYTPTGNFFNMSNLERVKARPNMGSQSVQTNFNFDFQPSDNIILTVGGNVNYSGNNNGPNESNGGDAPNPNSYQNLYNFSNNSFSKELNYNAFVQFRQTFNTGMADTGSLLKNVYYQVQADYSNRLRESYDTRFNNRLNEYNYMGKIETTTSNLLLAPGVFAQIPRIEGIDSLGNPVVDPIEVISTQTKRYDLQNVPTGLTFTPSTLNPDLAAINSQIFRENNVVSDFMLLTLGGYLNGTAGGGITDQSYFFPQLGKSMTAYSKSSDQQAIFLSGSR